MSSQMSMMAEALHESEEVEEEEGQRTELRDGDQTTDQPDRTKPEHFNFSHLQPSTQTAIKQTTSNFQCDNTTERRRPEITIVAPEPLASNDWFPGHTVVFPPPQSDWSASVQVVSQVIKEKTWEDHIAKPTAAPRRATCTATSATQTDSVEENTAQPPAKGGPAGIKPKKPPRPSLPKAVDQEPVTERGEKVATNTVDQHDSKYGIKLIQNADSSRTHIGSVTVFWDFPTNHPSVSALPTENTSPASNGQRPIPRPRTKLHKQVTEREVKVETDKKSSSPEISTNKNLKDFCGGEEPEERTDATDQSGEKFQLEEEDVKMSANHSQRNIRARIQAFESQADTEEEHAFESVKPDPLPRRTANKPPVGAKPSLSRRTQSTEDNNQNIPTTNKPQHPTPAPRPLPPKKPVGLSVREELESLHRQGTFPHRSRPSVLTRSNNIDEEELSPALPILPVKPPKEPLKPNLNVNNHNSTSLVRENEDVESPSNNILVKPQNNVDCSEGSFTRKSITRRPTTIRVPSQTGSMLDHFQDAPPPLPVQKPVGSLSTSVSNKQSLTPALQNSIGSGPEPTLPPRRSIVNKSLPPRPPPAKSGPGRPPPPSLQASGRSQSASRQPSPKPQAQKPHRKGFVLPPRPNPGHRLYNKYTLQLPHGIAAFDYKGSNPGELSFQKNEVLLLLDEVNHNEFECQVGNNRGRVHKSRMKIITPLGTDFFTPKGAAPPASAGDGLGLRVQALHDFIQDGPGELGLRAGDVVTGAEQVDSQWYRGTCRGSTGFFPISYVKVLSNSPKPLPGRKATPQPAPVSGPRCVARFDFEGEHSDELTFSEGDVIQLKEYEGEDWARGQIGSSVGIFPLNFVDILEDLPPPASQQQHQPSSRVALPGMVAASSSTQSEAAKPAQAATSSVEWVVALYDYAAQSAGDLSFQQGDHILITKHINEEWSSGRLSGREGIFPNSFVQTTSGQNLSGKQNEATGGTRATVLYDFTSDCDEELSVQAGDIITNLESIDEEWFLGDSKGKRALVPKNYVQVLG
ncbi:SH3 domain-containing protein 19 isoform X2 [Cololabis saira]|uniref:SH3 domain-containing protein 19 isoform X2 n=1 Tax=Cololabis saira TaxID=129043 RepID=UPI002AD48E47|nr:SH3 domain-containing protein 19 isoform X2 [Cololabis saira]